MRRFLPPIALLALLLVSAHPVSAADFTISDVEVSPEIPVTGKPTTFTVNIENTGSQTVTFTDETTMKLSVDGEAKTSRSFLVKPNWTKPPIYLSVAPGETETWDLSLNQEVTGEREIRIVIEGPYEYGSKKKGLRVTWEDTVEFVNPQVRSFDIWVTTYDWGIKPSVTIANGNAYTGTGHIAVSDGNGTLFRETYELKGENSFIGRVPYDEFYTENGTYTVEAGFGGKTATKDIYLAITNSSGGDVEASAPGSEESDDEKEESTVPGFGVLVLTAALVVGLHLSRR